VIDLKNVTFGCEYEFGDIWRTELPKGLSWNGKDYSIVSSTGIANDPKGKVYTRGGEINSDPTSTVEEQLAMFSELLSLHPEAALNHRTNLHLHVRIPGLRDDLVTLKQLLAYVHANELAIYNAIEPIPTPKKTDCENDEAYKGALKRFKRRKVSHQYKVPADRVARALQAKTVDEFLAAHAPVTSKGEPAWGLTTRAGINLLQLKETDTVEFRHFTNTLQLEELESCFRWVANFVPMALDNALVPELLQQHNYKFPPFVPYNHAMEIGYQYTNFDKHSRKTVEKRLTAMRRDLNLESCRATEVTSWIDKNDPEQVL
jgi:hypothetical protein